MRFEPVGLEGAWSLPHDPVEDPRGFFARVWDRAGFHDRGLTADLAQCSLSYNRQIRTIRGLHYQAAPAEEAKLVRCIRGAVYDVLLDLRPRSPTYTRWIARELTADNRLALYVPAGVAHGYQTLSDDAELLYLISAPYVAELARGVRWNDPAFSIVWPLPAGVMSERDQRYADFQR
ncbi:MAG TPA: dTDP-4-dehydrorhamnose 3,5-epimerase family protein [Gemmatimonadaceae bacterium]|nr:dTDP-4-dehydrorhamnose 3,5-epimerase family protein [Gemmatimonadaceae bacterium]